MTPDEARVRSLDLLNPAGSAFLGTNGPDGVPWIKAMFKMENEGLERVWFSTNTSSKRVAMIAADGRASVYVADTGSFRGLLLLGEAEVRADREARERIWREGFERYYPLGVDDPDYSVIVFTAHRANYYEMLANVSFDIP
jgi:general stress protein 26